MITESGTIKVSTEMSEKVQKEFIKSTRTIGLVFTVIGAIGVAFFLVLEIIAVFYEYDHEGMFVILIMESGLLGLGIGLLVLVGKTVKAAGTINRTFVYEFCKDYFTASEILNGEQVSSAKIYNSSIKKVKETKGYLFIYVNAASACPVDKCGLSEAELNMLRSFFRYRGAAQAHPGFAGNVNTTGNLPASDGAPAQNDIPPVQSAPEEPDDPFEEFK